MNGSVTFQIPDFVAEDGTVFSEIEITIQSDDGDMHDAVRLAKTLERPSRKVDNG
jgi:hypothetical protein